jgi:hypothetical protein
MSASLSELSRAFLGSDAQPDDDDTAAAAATSAVPVEHLDYDYVRGCSDVAYLARIYQRLRSGAEGSYPDLERATLARIAALNPSHRLLSGTARAAAPLPQEMEQQLQALQNEPSSGAGPAAVPPVRATAQLRLGSAQPLKKDKNDKTDKAKPIAGCVWWLLRGIRRRY